MGARDKLTAAVLGCGPTGLLTAHGLVTGAEERGIDLKLLIFSAKRKSELYGCQYLHKPIPGLRLPWERVQYKLVGSIDGYRRKVYGDEEDVAVSPELLETSHTAYDIRAAYDQLWKLYEPAVTDYFFSQGSWALLDRRLWEDGIGLVFSSLPAPVLCQENQAGEASGCTFSSQQVWAMGDAPALGRWAAIPATVPPRTIVCNGDPMTEWYRASHVFSHGTIEWPEQITPPRGASRVSKPLKTSCRCNPHVIRVGRYGRWEKGVLAHTAFEQGYQAALRWGRD